MNTYNLFDPKLYTPAEVSFNPQTAYIVARLHYEDFTLPAGPIRYQGITLQPKDEFHITIVSRNASDILLEYLKQNQGGAEYIRSLISRQDWFYRKLDRFYWVREGDAATIIQMVEVPALDDFFTRLCKLVGRELPMPPTHVTLFMHATEKGIGIPAQADFKKLVQGVVDLNQVEYD